MAPKPAQTSTTSTAMGVPLSNNGSAQALPTGTIEAGALAGGIVGAFFGGVILALMAAYAFNQVRKGPSCKPKKSKSVGSVQGAFGKRSLDPPTINTDLECLLPQPVDDEKMSSIVRSLLDRVALHVDNFYTRKMIHISAPIFEQFDKMPAIKHCIAFTLTTMIMHGDDPSNKLIPIHLAAVPRKLAPSPNREKDTTAVRQAYSIWKVLTSFLLPKLADEPLLADHRRHVTTSIIDNISAAFRDWEVTSGNASQAVQNLAEIVSVAFDVGMRISSQACVFDFEWHQHRSYASEETEGFVVLPGFRKIVDEQGHVPMRPQVLVRPMTHRSRRDR